jgi:hypothetical protein
VLVVAQELIRGPRVSHREAGEAFLNPANARGDSPSTTESFAFEPLAERCADGLGDGFAGGLGQGAGKAIGFWVLDAEGHFYLSILLDRKI